MAPYPDIPAEMPGVQLLRSDLPPTPTPAPTIQDEPDWAQMADKAITNADLDHADHLPTPPEVIVIDDDNNDSLPINMHCYPSKTIHSKIEPMVEPTSTPAPVPPPSHCYPTCLCQPSKHLESFHLFTTVAEDTKTSYPYIDASGNLVDLAFIYENTIVQVCHYIMLYCADSVCIGNPNNKKQYGLKAGLCKFADRGSAALMKELCQFHMLKCFTPQDPTTLSCEDKRKALASLMFLTEKNAWVK